MKSGPLCHLRIISNKHIVELGDDLSPQFDDQLQRTPAPGRWQNGQLMFSAVEVELLMGLVFIVGMMYICWNTMPDGSGREGKYL